MLFRSEAQHDIRALKMGSNGGEVPRRGLPDVEATRPGDDRRILGKRTGLGSMGAPHDPDALGKVHVRESSLRRRRTARIRKGVQVLCALDAHPALSLALGAFTLNVVPPTRLGRVRPVFGYLPGSTAPRAIDGVRDRKSTRLNSSH